MVMDEIIQGKKLAKDFKPQVDKAKEMTEEERTDFTIELMKKYDFHNKLKVISSIIVLKSKIKSKDGDYVDYILNIVDKSFHKFEKKRFGLFCKKSIAEIKEKKKLDEKDQSNIKDFQKMMRFVENE